MDELQEKQITLLQNPQSGEVLMKNFKIAIATATMLIGFGSATVAHADCAMTAGTRTGTLMKGDYVFFDQASANKAPAGVKNTYRLFTDPAWTGLTIQITPTGTRASYSLANGSHGWLPEGKQSTLPAGTVGVGCYPVKK